ncbi:hypothetical protein EB796_011672 [Bugula neritina]|uniref:Uncharacterized protein n=1 Tax=Bugula neritina TaxID=10212 RepID=A0A7J7JVM7_BUGNE|nr:hypothetical protein EB796_011672 [Bugula neritina]
MNRSIVHPKGYPSCMVAEEIIWHLVSKELAAGHLQSQRSGVVGVEQRGFGHHWLCHYDRWRRGEKGYKQ